MSGLSSTGLASIDSPYNFPLFRRFFSRTVIRFRGNFGTRNSFEHCRWTQNELNSWLLSGDALFRIGNIPPIRRFVSFESHRAFLFECYLMRYLSEHRLLYVYVSYGSFLRAFVTTRANSCAKVLFGRACTNFATAFSFFLGGSGWSEGNIWGKRGWKCISNYCIV